MGKDHRQEDIIGLMRERSDYYYYVSRLTNSNNTEYAS